MTAAHLVCLYVWHVLVAGRQTYCSSEPVAGGFTESECFKQHPAGRGGSGCGTCVVHVCRFLGTPAALVQHTAGVHSQSVITHTLQRSLVCVWQGETCGGFCWCVLFVWCLPCRVPYAPDAASAICAAVAGLAEANMRGVLRSLLGSAWAPRGFSTSEMHCVLPGTQPKLCIDCCCGCVCMGCFAVGRFRCACGSSHYQP